MVVYGLYGAATSKWDMSAKVEESGAFDAFWDTLSFVVNGIVFFFSGIACINFFVRCALCFFLLLHDILCDMRQGHRTSTLVTACTQSTDLITSLSELQAAECSRPDTIQ